MWDKVCQLAAGKLRKLFKWLTILGVDTDDEIFLHIKSEESHRHLQQHHNLAEAHHRKTTLKVRLSILGFSVESNVVSVIDESEGCGFYRDVANNNRASPLL